MRDKAVDKVSLYLTTECNSQCKYCFVMKYRKSIESMSFEMVDKIMDYVDKKLAEGVALCFFGGEPLLKFDLIKHIIEKYPTLSYALPTNGLLFNEEVFDFCKKHRDFVWVTFSIDGDKETQLLSRGNYPNIDMVKKAFRELRAGIRMVVEDPKKLYENVRYLHSLGPWKISVGIPRYYDLCPGYEDEFKKQMKMVEDDMSLRSIPIEQDESNDCTTHCEAAYDYIAIGTNGDIFPCDIFCVNNICKIGDISTGIDREKVNKFLDEKSLGSDGPCIAYKYL